MNACWVLSRDLGLRVEGFRIKFRVIQGCVGLCFGFLGVEGLAFRNLG